MTARAVNKPAVNKPAVNKKRALVTGGAGFLGSHLCDGLLADGYRVLAADNLLTGRLENLAGVVQHPKYVFEKDVQHVQIGF